MNFAGVQPQDFASDFEKFDLLCNLREQRRNKLRLRFPRVEEEQTTRTAFKSLVKPTGPRVIEKLESDPMTDYVPSAPPQISALGQ